MTINEVKRKKRMRRGKKKQIGRDNSRKKGEKIEGGKR